MLIAGLIDGLNPCAFATIIFLFSYLSFLGKANKEILTYGIIFTLGVFIAYILTGMGLMAGLRQLSGFPLITKGIYLVIGMFAFVLGIISFYDYLQFRRGHMEKMKLQLPMALKKRIHGIIRKQTRSSKAGCIATFTLGFVIAITEVVCTGQVYPPNDRIYHDPPQVKGPRLFISRSLQCHVHYTFGGDFRSGLFWSHF